ncbi:MAG: MFS transporter [Myxococcales bacterium]|nr:MFS transporter [Myxococcales bacterium]
MLTPSTTAWRGASIGVGLLTLAVIGSAAVGEMTADSRLGPIVVAVAVLLGAALLIGLALLLLGLLARAPLHFRWTAGVGLLALLLAMKFVPVEPMIGQGLVLGALLLSAVTGGAVAVLVRGRWRDARGVERAVPFALALLGLATLGLATRWLLVPSDAAPAPANAALRSRAAASPAAPAAPAALPSPAQRGSWEVKTLTYGAGTDLLREEFGSGATLRTKPVDGSGLLESWSGVTGWARTRFWGFDSSKLPLNGRVWFPSGDGPFPLVLMTHGNHTAADFSDVGYRYLGELLASRGYIFVSLDENFLNSMDAELFGGLESENGARGWLLLEHLRVWHAWNADRRGPFAGKVDTARIALIGHSRGGEAAAHAAAFNRMAVHPDDGTFALGYGYAIRSVIAIAPTEGQHQPGGTDPRLRDVNYLVLQGSHDSDMSSFQGLNQYDRVGFPGVEDRFKSAIYIHGANHGQFNSTWGRFDAGEGLMRRFINPAVLLRQDDQQRVAAVYVSAFLDCTLRGVRALRPLFWDWRYGAAWLPSTIYLTQYEDSTMKVVASYEEDADLATGTALGSSLAGHSLSGWREGPVPLRGAPARNRAATLAWSSPRQGEVPSYAISWPAGSVPLLATSVLSFALADAAEDPAPDDARDDEQRDATAALDLSVQLRDRHGHTARLPLSHVSSLQRQLETPALQAAWLHAEPLSEPILQTFRFSLADFLAVTPQLDLGALVELRLLFDRSRAGAVLLDQVGFMNPR